MISKLRIDTLISGYISCHFDKLILKNVIHWDCQDTDDDNATECYFYVSNKTNKELLDLIINEIAEMLKVDPKWAIIEDQTEEGNPEIRIEFIVEIGDRFGVKFK